MLFQEIKIKFNMNTIPAITPRELSSRLSSDKKPHLIDVRTPLEHREIHLPEAQLMPLDVLDTAAIKQQHGTGRECVVICRSGKRALAAAEKLCAAGMENIHVLEGGMLAWNDAGLPAKHGEKVMSLERQVRIAAGAIVFIGVLLAHFINPAFIWLSGFVGAGLVFAGITDTCAMGMMIARMPWNKAGACSVR